LKCSETYRRNYLTEIVTVGKSKMYAVFYKSAFVIKLDETTDANGRYILNIMGQPLNGSVSRHYLIDITELERCNSVNIISELRFILPRLIQDKENRHLFLYMLTDGAPYCHKLGCLLKEDYPHMKHVVCLCHNLHLVVEDIRKNNTLLNQFIVEIKKILVKNKTNGTLYYETTQLNMIKFPVITRWGTFLECTNFIYENFD